MQGYTTRDAAELLDLSPAQIRGFARAGLLAPARGPRGEFRFSFQDIVALRTAKELVRARVPVRRVKRALRKLMAELPNGRPLSAVRVSADGDQVVVREPGVAWDVESGQASFDFGVAELAAGLAPAVQRMVARAEHDRGFDADDWYALALELEAVSAEEAMAGYARALELDSEHADAAVNLGRLHQETGALADAERCYLRALAADPRHATAAFNLGTVLEDLGRPGDALAAYGRAIEIDPDFVDAHFNLARLYERQGKRQRALRHLRSFRALTLPTS